MKKRLLGAAVLIALAVIFVPMLLPGHASSGSDSVNLKIPPEPEGAMQTRILKVGPDSASAGTSARAAIGDPDHVTLLNLDKHPVHAPGSAPKGVVLDAREAPAAAGSAASAKPGQTGHAAELAAAKPAPTPQASASAPGPVPGGAGAAAGANYLVNLGIYTDRGSADKLVANAKQQGFVAQTSQETFKGKPVTRVRVGPFHSRAQAEAARLKLRGVEHVAMTIDSVAVNQKGDAPASAVAAGQPGAWAVQLGAFSVQKQADALRDRLRAQGFDGYVDSIDVSKRRLWRVRAGPFASRNVAVATRGQIAQKLKIKGDIVTQE